MMTHKLRDMPQHMFGSGGSSNHSMHQDTSNLSPASSSTSTSEHIKESQRPPSVPQQQQPPPPPISQHESSPRHQSHPQSHSIRIKSESELSPSRPSSDCHSSRINSNNNNLPIMNHTPERTPPPPPPQQRLDPRDLPILPQFQMQSTENSSSYQMMLDRQQIKSESRLKRSPSEIEQPNPKRPLGKSFKSRIWFFPL